MSRSFMSFKGFLIEVVHWKQSDRFVGTLVDSNPAIAFEFKGKGLHDIWSEYLSIVNALLPDHLEHQNIFTETFANPESFVGRRIMQTWAESVSGQICTVKKVSPCADGNHFLVDTIDQDGAEDRLTLREGQIIRVLKDKKLLFQDLPLGQKFHFRKKYGNPLYVKTSPSQYAEITQSNRACMFSTDSNSEVCLVSD